MSIWNIGITLSAYTVFQSWPCPEKNMDGLNLVPSLDIWCTGQCILEPLSVFRNFLQHVQANMLGKISKDWQCKHEKEGWIHGQGLFGYCQSNIEKIHFVFFLTHERVWIISWVWDSRKSKVIKKPNMVHFQPFNLWTVLYNVRTTWTPPEWSMCSTSLLRRPCCSDIVLSRHWSIRQFWFHIFPHY